MDVGRERAYSALEVVSHQRAYQKLSTAEGKEVAPHEGKQVSPDDGKQHVVNEHDGLEVVAKGDSFFHEHSDDYGNHHLHVRRSSRKKWLLGGAFGLIAILVVVLGSVFGSRHKRSATTSQTSPPNSTGPSNSSALFPSALPVQHSIAALSFASNNVNHTRVYFQDNAGQIMEAANSADNTTWSINGTGIVGKNGSAIAAAVSRPGFAEVSHLSSLPIDSDRCLFRSSVFSIWISVTLSTNSPTPSPQINGHRELYQVKDIPRCQTPA